MELTIKAGDISPSQGRFLRSMAPFVCFAGGYGSGKSTALALKVLWLAIMNPGKPGLLIAQTFGSLYTNVVGELMRIVRLTLPAKHHPRLISDPMNPRIVFPNGSIIYLRSAENHAGYEGLTVAWLCGDEIRYWTRKAYDVAISRVRMPTPFSQRAFATTPDMNWITDEFNTPRVHHETVTCGTHENARNLDPLYIENLRSSYSSRLQRAVIEGEFTILEGAVFETFDPNPQKSPWLIDYVATKEKLAGKRSYLAVDPGYRKSAWLWVVEEKPLEWVVYDELMLDHTTDIVAVQLVNAKKWPIDEIWVDPAADNTQSATGVDTLQMLRGVTTRNSAPLRTLSEWTRDIPFGIEKTRVLLGGEGGLPIRLKFARHLCSYESERGRGIIRDLGALRYPEMKDGRAITDRPLKDGRTDHSSDALRYWVCGIIATTPALRLRDPAIAKLSPGYRTAA